MICVFLGSLAILAGGVLAGLGLARLFGYINNDRRDK